MKRLFKGEAYRPYRLRYNHSYRLLYNLVKFEAILYSSCFEIPEAEYASVTT
ncbi:MAG: hypothetical protein LBJ00_00570 [Planctomycetaceae bacterium]|nr:hypothetical protein [Planctomycetaceae bacterium]